MKNISKKYIKRSILIIMLSIILGYVTNITAIPNNIILFENEKLNLGQVLGVTVKEKENVILPTSNINNKVEEKTLTLSLFNVIDVKDVKVSVIENTKVIPLGKIIGLKIYSNGVLVIGMTEVGGVKPYETSNIKEGDLIVAVDNINVTTTAELVKCVNDSKGKTIEIKYIRDGKEHKTNIEPTKTANNEYKIGLWVRDGALRDRNGNLL